MGEGAPQRQRQQKRILKRYEPVILDVNADDEFGPDYFKGPPSGCWEACITAAMIFVAVVYLLAR